MTEAPSLDVAKRFSGAAARQTVLGRCLAASAILLVVCGGYLGWLQWNGNIHEVVPGRFYRSAQLGETQLRRIIDRNHIQTVINLRGASPGAAWYEDELKVSRETGADHLDFPMSASRRLTPDESFRLVEMLREAKAPILIHCKNGADRTGLASVIYLQQIAGIDEGTAEWQLTPLFGHIGIPFTGPSAMDDTWEDFEKLVGLPS